MSVQCEYTFLEHFSLLLILIMSETLQNTAFPKCFTISASGCGMNQEMNQDLKMRCAGRVPEQAIKMHYLFVNEISQ